MQNNNQIQNTHTHWNQQEQQKLQQQYKMDDIENTPLLLCFS